ncbi:serine hydrolase domain-containing protein [Henriciella aquimarina]|uniref:serine hydrolase domain-containing protein n=1 Tax=Henriciella aquimarina TaxID=545261 RepID=UPI000A01DA92|nr:serine hydrolase domain-containing protein [Henriciella aquimarina]
MVRTVLAIILSAGLCVAARAQAVDETWLKQAVDETRESHDLIALGAAVAIVGREPTIAVSGTVSKGSDTPVARTDAWHIGSNTKALTALLYARLAEDGLADWGDSLPDLFPKMAEEMDPAWQDTRIEDLFAHRSGLGQIGPIWVLARRNDDAPVREQRLATVESRLTKPPAGEPGTFEYSNLNYIVAGAAIERLIEMSWEDAIKAYIFDAEGASWSEGWGFGPPQTGLEGHNRNIVGWRSSVGRGKSADNPEALGPAGTAHVPLASHARLLLQFVDEDSTLITPDMRDHLLAPWPDETANYAMGLAVSDHPQLGRVYLHNGSNTMWLSRIALVPSHDAVIIVNTNEYSDAAKDATGILLEKLQTKLAEDS